MSAPGDVQQEYLDVSVLSAARVAWEGKARSVSSRNSQGDFDILPRHANFITLINDYPVRVTTSDGQEIVHSFTQSVISVKGNVVKIFGNVD